MPRDIEEFLKMAAARRAKQKQQAGGNPPAGRPAPPQQPPRQLPKQPLHQVDDDEILVLPEDPGIHVGKTVGQHVQAHLDTSDIADHASHLGHEVGQADEKLESRLHQKFDHSVGHLKIDPSRSAQSETTAVTETAVSHIAQELVAMLSSPKSVRQAIILNEILRRPEF